MGTQSNSNDNTSRLLDKYEVAAILHVSVRTLMGKVAKRQGPPFIEVGKQYRWSRQWVEDWIQVLICVEK
jgi:predicted DNA-binding transcriptional regulator AlpA